MIREKDLIYIDTLDRLSRNYDGIIAEWNISAIYYIEHASAA
jgi:hypothetical protein